MSPVEMRGRPAIAGNRASREIKSPPAVAGMVAAVVRTAAVVAEMAELAQIVAVVEEMAEVAQIVAAGKSASEDFRC
jgi:hypothetical protein